MTTLTTGAVAPLLDRHFTAGNGFDPAAFADLSRKDIGRIMRSKTGYADFYTRMKDVPMAVSRETGTLLYMLVSATRARSSVEFGTSFGLSTIEDADKNLDCVIS